MIPLHGDVVENALEARVLEDPEPLQSPQTYHEQVSTADTAGDLGTKQQNAFLLVLTVKTNQRQKIRKTKTPATRDYWFSWQNEKFASTHILLKSGSY